MEVETKFFYSSCLKYLKTDIQNLGYLKGLSWLMNRIGNVQLWILLSKLTFILLRIRIIG